MTEAPQQLSQLTRLPPAPRRFGHSPQLKELRDPEDDWTGITSTSDRRRRQNRLNQRAYRRRRQLAQNDSVTQVVPEEGCLNGIAILSTPRERAIAHAFMQLAHVQYSLNKHRPALLPSLIRLNAVNAVSNNALHIGIPLEGLCCDDVISPWNRLGPQPASNALAKASCPGTLRPTSLQREVVHHPWVDLLPFPQLRDNIINGYTDGTFDEDILCVDLLGLACSQNLDDSFLIVWGESADPATWEVSVGFLKKWGWLLKGCPELAESTNRWRLQRGEKMLDIQV
ncbi:hypothetical protein F66182_5027 [Fusarium sp. NRRL 66182]|nr:hypothetical protein F66182_5027 [Fusarium sp. NRRL 66182]